MNDRDSGLQARSHALKKDFNDMVNRKFIRLRF